MGNIRIHEGHALFGENCCTCLSCFHWCPVKAIWMPKGEEEMKRIAHCVALTAKDFEGTAEEVKATVAQICQQFPLYR